MNQYNNFTVEELAINPSFTNWVLKKNTQDIELWETWITENPQRIDVCLQARSLVLALNLIYQTDELTDKAVQQNVRELVTKAEASLQHHQSRVYALRRSHLFGWTIVAAVTLLLVGFWVAIRSNWSDTKLSSSLEPPQSTMVERVNSSTRPMTILLSDGSVVTLSPNSSLTYPLVFAHKQRLVTLAGEAFFEVAKNPRKPFLVFTDRSVTKVLGTSFRIKAFTRQSTVKVLVRTGQVAVYAVTRSESNAKSTFINQKGVLIIPDQQVEIDNGHLVKSRVVRHELVAATQVGPSEISFDDQPVTDVLLTLSRLYEVDIEFDNELLANCRITTSFSEETLPERLSSICRAINATYKIENDKVQLSSHGCTPIN